MESVDLTVANGNGNPLVERNGTEDLKRAIQRYAAAATRAGMANPLAEALRWEGKSHLIGTRLTDDVLYAETRRYIHEYHDDLVHSEPYIISPIMHATTIAAAYTLTDDDSLMFHADDLPSPTGVLLLPKHMIIDQGPDAVPQDLIALSWTTTTVEINGEPIPSIQIRSWLDTFGPVQVDDFSREVSHLRKLGIHMPPWILLGSTAVTLRSGDDDTDPEIDSVTREMLGVSLLRPKSQLGGAGVSAEYDGESVIEGQDLRLWPQKYLLAFFRLAGQKIADVSNFRDGVDERAKYQRHHDTRVVQLRSYNRDQEQPDGATHRHYTNQFTVRMHRVRQWYPKAGVHKVIWRGPFVKGPKDAPMVEGIKVNAVTR